MGFSKLFVEEIKNLKSNLLMQAVGDEYRPAIEALLRVEATLDPAAVQARIHNLEFKELLADCERAIKAAELLQMLASGAATVSGHRPDPLPPTS
jgi:hypothetical protein